VREEALLTDPDGAPRLAGEADLPALTEIIRAAYDPYLARMEVAPAPLTEDLRPRIRDGHVWIVGRPVEGLICLRPVDEALLIQNVAVHPNAQGTGVGRMLMDFAEEMARRKGLDRVSLYTNEVMTENLAIYRHLGYREVARRTEEGYRRVFMEKALGEER
jgi:GNAT superfamily N-acetyltransferase